MRKSNTRNQRSLNVSILIICEGETEKLYFGEIKNSLPREKQRGLVIDIERAKGRSPINIVKEAIVRKKTAKTKGAPYDEVWVVFDHDNFPNRQAAFQLAEKAGISIAYSSINIEVWYIFHYEYRTTPFANGQAAKKYFESKYINKYKPGTTRVFESIKSLTHTAIDNAEKLRNHHKETSPGGAHLCTLNPYLTIDELVNYLINL
jgi:hypothetical protein